MPGGHAWPGRSLRTVTAHATGAQTPLSARPVAWGRVLIAAAMASLLTGAALAPAPDDRSATASSAAHATPALQPGLASLPRAARAPVSNALGAAIPAYQVSSSGA